MIKEEFRKVKFLTLTIRHKELEGNGIKKQATSNEDFNKFLKQLN